jgi:hypothetical protein
MLSFQYSSVPIPLSLELFFILSFSDMRRTLIKKWINWKGLGKEGQSEVKAESTSSIALSA